MSKNDDVHCSYKTCFMRSTVRHMNGCFPLFLISLSFWTSSSFLSFDLLSQGGVMEIEQKLQD